MRVGGPLLIAVVAVAVAGCPEPAAPPPSAAPWVYAPDLAPWPPAPVTGAIGRGALLPLPVPAGVAAGHRVWADEPLDVEALWTVPPGDAAAPARAIASGFVGDAWAVEEVDVDDGVVRWRDLARCASPVAHVSAGAVVCADAVHAVGLDLADGHERWRRDLEISGATGGLVLAADDGAVVVIDALDGRELARALIPDLGDEQPHAACRTEGGGFDVFAWSAVGPVRRIAISGDGGARIVWSTLVGAPLVFDPVGARAGDACDDVVLITTPGDGPDGESLVALDRASGAVRGGPVAAIGHWPARDAKPGDGAIELATAAGIDRRARDLGAPVRISDAQVGALVASRGARRLVRARAGGLVLLGLASDARTTLAAPLGVGRAVLGDRFVLSGPWRGIRTDRDALRRYPLPLPLPLPEDATDPLAPAPVDDPTRYDHPDLPAAIAVDAAAAIAQPDAGAYYVATAALDPAAPHILYAVPLEQRPTATQGAGVAAYDLRARRWLWHRADGCPPGTPEALAISRDAIVCAARAFSGNSGVRATARADGRALWSWSGPVDTVIAGGGLVAIIAASRVTLVDATTGAERDRFAADDGWMPRLVITDTGLVIDAERGAVVARDAGLGMLPRWSLRVRGTVAQIAPAGDRVAVVLGDGELYLVDPATGDAHAAGAWSDTWRVPGGGDLAVVPTKDREHREWRVAGYGADGVLRFRVALAVEPDWQLGQRGRAADAPLALAWGPVLQHVAIFEPRRGALRGIFALPERSVPGLVFATVVDGKPVTGAVLSHPLAVVTF